MQPIANGATVQATPGNQDSGAFMKGLSWVLLAALLPMGHSQAQVPPAAPLRIDDDGTVHVPAHAVPPSAFLSPGPRVPAIT
jgi:hypothetical protein